MKKRVFGILMILVLGIVLLTGCKKTAGTPDSVVENDDTEEEQVEEVTGYTFGFTCIDMANPYFESLQLSIQTAVEESGNSLMTFDSAGDTSLQLDQIHQMIDAEVDAVFLCPVDWEAITPGIDALNEADIPIINIDTQVKDIDKVTAYIGSDNKNAGYVCGENMINRLRDGGQILVLECQTMNSINDRITGFEEAIAGSGFEVVARVNASGEKETARSEVERLLAENGEIDAIMCGNDQMALGALEAVKAADRTNILIYGVDGSPEVKTEIATGTSSIMATGAQSPINIGKTAVKTALAIMNGDDYEESVYEETFLIDRTNVQLYGTDGWQ